MIRYKLRMNLLMLRHDSFLMRWLVKWHQKNAYNAVAIIKNRVLLVLPSGQKASIVAMRAKLPI